MKPTYREKNLPDHFFVECSGPPLNQVWVLFKPTCVFTGMHFTKHFIKFVLVETNQLFGSSSNVILTGQTCGHRSSDLGKANAER